MVSFKQYIMPGVAVLIFQSVKLTDDSCSNSKCIHIMMMYSLSSYNNTSSIYVILMIRRFSGRQKIFITLPKTVGYQTRYGAMG